MEITRKITATETTEVEHKGRTHERVVQGQVVIKSNQKLYFSGIFFSSGILEEKFRN
jgi:hypothetical protein